MNYSIKPEEYELREAKQVIEGVLASCQIFKEKESDFKIELGWEPEIHAGSDTENRIFIGFNTSEEDWKEKLKTATAYGYAHSLYYEMGEQPVFNWQQVLMDSFGLMLLDEILPEQAGKETEDVEEYEIDNWVERKKELEEEIDYESENIPWQVSYLIGRRLLKRYSLEEFPDLKRSQVMEAGDETFL